MGLWEWDYGSGTMGMGLWEWDYRNGTMGMLMRQVGREWVQELRVWAWCERVDVERSMRCEGRVL